MHLYNIDVVGTCNLRCPSCPVGNMRASDFQESPRKKGFMTLELFTSVVDKIIADSAALNRPFFIDLFNWAEPMLHPEFDEICRILAKRKVQFSVSSNMNHEASFVELVRSANGIRASVSGFSNEIYQKSHVGGDINLLISNLYRLRYVMDKVKRSPFVQVLYHVYKDNCDEEMKKLQTLSESLGFKFIPVYAYFMGLEKYLSYREGSDRFSEKDRQTNERMIFSIDEAIEIAKYGHQSDCILRQEQTVINHDGSVPVCCAVFDPVNFVANDFLSISPQELQAKKMSAAICEKCMDQNIHNVAVYNPKEMFEEIAIARMTERKQKYVTRFDTEPLVAEVLYTDQGFELR